MLSSLALIFLIGLSMAAICAKVRLPRIIGMLVTGVVLGPYVLDLLDPSILGISAELRQIALLIILIKAGLSLDVSELRKVGRPALMMSFVPALSEIAAYLLFAPLLLGVSRIEAAMIGAVLAAVSPAVVVPRMVSLMDEGYGTDKQIPQLILAGASLDDVFVIVLFSTVVGMAQGQGADIAAMAALPLSIGLGILLGAVAGVILALLFETAHRRGASIRQSMKVILVLGTACLLMAVQTWLENLVSVSGLLAVMSMACVVKLRCRPEVSGDLSAKYGKLWLAAEVLLFVLVGAVVDIRYTMAAGGMALLMILLALAVRACGVCLCMVGTKLTAKERLYCVFAYLPKATVQAAIGSVPLALGLPCGKLVLSIAVLAILVTAPLGATLMDLSYQKLLQPTKK